jgi:hypothetical protein
MLTHEEYADLVTLSEQWRCAPGTAAWAIVAQGLREAKDGAAAELGTVGKAIVLALRVLSRTAELEAYERGCKAAEERGLKGEGFE